MQVSVEESGVIERKLTISVPAEKIETEVAKRLKARAKDARIPGFRPGKAPHSIITKRYSPQITHEVINDTINTSYMEALNQEEINPAGLVSIEPTPYEAGKVFTYIATIELFPPIPAPTLEGKTIEKPMVEITDEDVLHALEEVRKRHVNFVAKSGKSVLADRITIDFEGKIEGKAFEDGSATDFPVILGAEQLLAQFEAGLLGLQKGDHKTINFTFPENYGNTGIASKDVEFAVTVKAVEKPELPDMNDDFAKSLGIESGGIEEMKQKIRTNLQRTVDMRLRDVLRDRVFDALYVANDIETPQALVEMAIDRGIKEVTRQLTDRGLPAGGLPADTIDRDNYVDRARKSVALELIVRAVVEKFTITADPDAVRARAVKMMLYAKESGDYDEWCRANTDTLRYINAMEQEDQVVTRMLETATVKQQKVSFKTFMSATD